MADVQSQVASKVSQFAVKQLCNILSFIANALSSLNEYSFRKGQLEALREFEEIMKDYLKDGARGDSPVTIREVDPVNNKMIIAELSKITDKSGNPIRYSIISHPTTKKEYLITYAEDQPLIEQLRHKFQERAGKTMMVSMDELAKQHIGENFATYENLSHEQIQSLNQRLMRLNNEESIACPFAITENENGTFTAIFPQSFLSYNGTTIDIERKTRAEALQSILYGTYVMDGHGINSAQLNRNAGTVFGYYNEIKENANPEKATVYISGTDPTRMVCAIGGKVSVFQGGKLSETLAFNESEEAQQKTYHAIASLDSPASFTIEGIEKNELGIAASISLRLNGGTKKEVFVDITAPEAIAAICGENQDLTQEEYIQLIAEDVAHGDKSYILQALIDNQAYLCRTGYTNTEFAQDAFTVKQVEAMATKQGTEIDIGAQIAQTMKEQLTKNGFEEMAATIPDSFTPQQLNEYFANKDCVAAGLCDNPEVAATFDLCFEKALADTALMYTSIEAQLEAKLEQCGYNLDEVNLDEIIAEMPSEIQPTAKVICEQFIEDAIAESNKTYMRILQPTIRTADQLTPVEEETTFDDIETGMPDIGPTTPNIGNTQR